MKTNWQQVKRRRDSSGRWLAPYVTMNPKGKISFTRVTYEQLGEPKVVHLFYDPVNHRIGIKRTHTEAADTFKVSTRGRCGGRRIFAYGLIQEQGIDLPETVQFHGAHFDDQGILTLDLRSARVPASVQNHRSNKKKRTAKDNI
ncbi:MAG: hypothetical protein IPG67_17455 [Acidobacteria bacterium]|nr:hypothetical protein [Acidobacteriota bacterium]MBK7935174.1 hypothetical protein [Acidobacteriota bacterium]